MKRPVNNIEDPHLDSQGGDINDRHDSMQVYELWNITSQTGYSFISDSNYIHYYQHIKKKVKAEIVWQQWTRNLYSIYLES